MGARDDDPRVGTLTATAADVLITSELASRPVRPPDHAAESRALAALAQALLGDPDTVLQRLVECVVALCQADSAGVSILEPSADGQDCFRWHAIAGPLSANRGGTLPRAGSPCGTVLARDAMLLIADPARAYPALRGVAPPIHESLLVPWRVDGRPVGTLWAVTHTPGPRFDAEDARLLARLAEVAAAAWQAGAARAAAEAARRELQALVGRLLAAHEEERRRVAYAIHDGLTQVAAGTHLRLQGLADQLPALPPAARADLDRALVLARRTVDEARRVIAELRPIVLDDYGLAAALRQAVEARRAAGLHISFYETLGTARLPWAVETALYRVALEALTNVRQHAGATRVRVSLARTGDAVCLAVADNGRGFAPHEARHGGVAGARVGLAGLRVRLALLGGECRIASRSEVGTLLVARLPLPAVAPTSADAGAGSREHAG